MRYAGTVYLLYPFGEHSHPVRIFSPQAKDDLLSLQHARLHMNNLVYQNTDIKAFEILYVKFGSASAALSYLPTNRSCHFVLIAWPRRCYWLNHI